MDKTQRLLGLALAVIALDGCRPASPDPNATPAPSSNTVPHVVTGAQHGNGSFGSSGFHGGG